MGDGIGLLGDRIRRKREFNAQKGIEEVRRKLETSGVSLDSITPPQEEELHLLLTGLSLTDDQITRGLWTGLFAKALEPNTGISAERPFISILQSLPPLDAKLIDFLAFTIRSEIELQGQIMHAPIADYRKLTEDEKQEVEKLGKRNWQLRMAKIEAVKDKAAGYGLDNLTGSAWAENLVR